MRERVVLKPRTDASAETFWSRVRDSSEYGPDFKLKSAAVVVPTPFGRQVDPCARSNASRPQVPTMQCGAVKREAALDKENQASPNRQTFAEYIRRSTASGQPFDPPAPVAPALPPHRLEIECDVLKRVIRDADEEKKNPSDAEMRAEIERLREQLRIVLRLNLAITHSMRVMHGA